jgi:hypothetical protein
VGLLLLIIVIIINSSKRVFQQLNIIEFCFPNLYKELPLKICID